LQAVKDFFDSIGPVDVEVHRMIAEGDLVAVHSHYKNLNMAAVDIVRLQRRRQDRRALGRPPAGARDDGKRQRHVQPAEPSIAGPPALTFAPPVDFALRDSGE
jgi:hypothetical protein